MQTAKDIPGGLRHQVGVVWIHLAFKPVGDEAGLLRMENQRDLVITKFLLLQKYRAIEY